MKRLLSNFGLFLWAEALIIALLLFSVDVHCFYRPLYDQTYAEVGTAEQIGVSETDLQRSTTVLLDYIRDERDDMDVEVTINGVTTPMFNEREITHMVDVKILYQNAVTVMWAGLIVFCGGLIALFVFQRKRLPQLFFRAVKLALIVSLILVLLLFVFVLIDFEAFWTTFHLLIFDNDLWILDPRRDNLILMVPSLFFNRLVLRIILTFCGFLLLLTVATVVDAVRRKKKNPSRPRG